MLAQEDGNFVTKLIDSYNQFSGCSILMVIIANSCYHQRRIVRVIQALQTVDQLVCARTDAPITRQLMLEFHVPSLMFVAGICAMEYYYCIMFIKDRPTYGTYCYLMCYAPLLVHVVTGLLFCAILQCVIDRLLILSQQQIFVAPVGDLKRAFEGLWGAAALLNQSFRLPILLLIFHQFTAVTTLTYDLVIAIVKYDFDAPGYDMEKIVAQLKSSGGWSLFFLAETLLVCLQCTRYHREFHRTGEMLARTIRDRPDCPQTRWMQLQVVATLKTAEASISAWGLFDVDLKLLYSMIGIITTYLIILVQFDIAQRTIGTASSTT